MTEFLDAHPWALPLIIFLGRICDVSLSTLRIIFLSKCEKKIAPLIGFAEVFIWVVIISQVIVRANDLVSFLAYAGGFAAGTYIGLHLEERIAWGFILYRVFTLKNGPALVGLLHEAGFGATLTHGEGSVSEIHIVEAAVGRKDAKAVEKIINGFDPKAFYLIEDLRAKQKGIFAKA
ncbi:MAG: DUF5698 domain-containing protein [Deltaproteobacteria bacterium]|nr:DUF5698 domain-containing protein [Deltaproteobacteria bacterium]